MKKKTEDTLCYFIILFAVLGAIAMLFGAGLGIAWKLGAILYEVEESILTLFIAACVCWAVAFVFCIVSKSIEAKEAKDDKKDV